MPGRPNVLFIMSDQHRADCLGCMGHPAVRTPHLDRIAGEGLVFTNAFCQSPVCMASRAALFTGRYPAAIGIRGMGILPPQETTTPEVFQRSGYRTGLFGKLHLTPELYTKRVLNSEVPVLDWRAFARDAHLLALGNADDPCKKDYGFQEAVGCEDCLQGHFHAWLEARAPALRQESPVPIPGGPGDLYVSPYPSASHPTTFIAQQAADFIRRTPGPWFTFCSFIGPHHPFEAPQDQIDRYTGVDLPAPEHKGGLDPAGIPASLLAKLGEMHTWTPEAIRRLVLHYLASISLIDDGVGILLRALADSGRAEDTIIVFTADHGEFLGNHGLVRKPSVHFDEVLRVPLILRLPGARRAGTRESGLVELVDVHPTLLGLAGIPSHPGIQGRDWSAAIRTGGVVAKADVHAEMNDACTRPETCDLPTGGPYATVQTLRTEAWKLNLYPGTSPLCGQLFDLRADPQESCDRFRDPACQEVRDDLLGRLLGRLVQNQDPLPRILSQW